MISDRIFGVVILFVALAYIASATQIQSSFLTDPVGPQAFPIGIGVVTAISALFLILRPDPDPNWPVFGTLVALIIATIVLIGYAYALKPLGFIIPTAIAAGILSFQISPRPVFAALAGVGLAVGLFIIFKYALGLSLFGWPKFLVG